MAKKSNKIIGIDLGTTNSCVAIMEGKESKVITNKEGTRTTPSIVAFKGNERLVGEPAKRQAVTNPENTIASAKRLIGRSMDDLSSEIDNIPYKIVAGKQNQANIQVQGKTVTPEEIGAHILTKMKETAENYLGEEVSRAVITVPAYFNDAQRQSTKDAGEIAGLKVERIINEPTAAALAYGLDEKNNKEQKIAVYDLGGGTFDISILEIADKVFQVLSTNGDTHLGGDDFDIVISNYVLNTFKKEEGIDLSKDKVALQRICQSAEKAKIELSGTMSTEINEAFITMDKSGPKHIKMTLTRKKLEDLVGHLVEKTVEPCRKAIESAKIDTSDIQTIILVGGMTRMPAIQQKVEEIFGKKPSKGVNPDEVVALGAAIQGGVLSGDVKDLLLLDVVPLSLGIETLGGKMTKIIEANKTIPCSKSQIFSTASDNQEAVTINVLQGERPMCSDNKTIGTFNLTKIPKKPKGMPKIEVTFDIDANGILTVSAKDKDTGRNQKIEITQSSGLSEEEIEAAKKDAEIHKEADQKKAQFVDMQNDIDALVTKAEKSLKDYKEKIPADLQTAISEKIVACKDSVTTENIDTMKNAKSALEAELQKIAQFAKSTDQTTDKTKKESAHNVSANDIKKKTKEEDVEDAEVEIVDKKTDKKNKK